MNLHHLKEHACEVCGAATTSERRSGQHTNGQWFESREFVCGRKIRWVPNFSGMEVDQQCRKHPEEVMKRAKRWSALISLRKHIDGLDVDEQWKALIGVPYTTQD